MRKNMFILLVLMLMSGCVNADLNLQRTQLLIATSISTPTHILEQKESITETPPPVSEMSTPEPESQDVPDENFFEYGDPRFLYAWDYYNNGLFSFDPNDLVQTMSRANFSSMAFANYTNGIAYIDLEDQLWVSDFDERNHKKIYKFAEGVLESNSAQGLVKLIWAPDDQHMFVDFRDPNQTDLIYHVQEEIIKEWNYSCDQLSISPKTKHLSIGCRSKVEYDEFMVLEWGGTYWRSDQVLGEVIFDLSESLLGETATQFDAYNLGLFTGWSRDGSLVAYYEQKTGSLVIRDSTGEILNRFPGMAFWNSDAFNSQKLPSFPIQWAQEKDKILLWTTGDEAHPCPELIYLDENGDKKPSYQPSCWKILSTTTNDIVWQESTIEQQRKIYAYRVDGDAALSADGTYLALSILQDGYLGELILVDILRNEIVGVVPIFPTKLHWGTGDNDF